MVKRFHGFLSKESIKKVLYYGETCYSKFVLDISTTMKG